MFKKLCSQFTVGYIGKRFLLAAAALVLLSFASAASAQRGSLAAAADRNPNFDIRTEQAATAVAYRDRVAASFLAAPAAASQMSDRAQGMARLRAAYPAIETVDNAELGSLEVLGVKPGAGFLTSRSTDRVGTLRSFLSTHADVYGLSAGQVAELELIADYRNASGNMAWVEFEQHINGLPVFRGLVRGGFTASGELVRVTGTLASGVTPGALAAIPTLSAAQAVSSAAANVGWSVPADALTVKSAAGGRTTFARGTMAADANAWLLYFPVAPGVTRLAWATEIWGDPDTYLILLDAEDGTPLFRKNLTNYQSQPATYNIYSAESPAPLSPTTVLPGSGTQAPFVPRVTVTLIGNEAPNTFNNLGWMTDGANSTDGNNVEAGIDRTGVNGVDAPVTGTSRTFNFAYDPQTDEPLTAEYQNGEVTDTFYWTNWYHDRLYLLGFTEAARNFQNDNFGRGGVGNDRISAESQDSSGTNNANFSTPTDGSRGRMQMYIFPGPTPDRTSGIDHDVLLHELTHGLSNRLHNNASGLTTTMSGGMGEGWSDFYARALLSSADEDPNGVYNTGGWVTYQLSGLTDNYYYGIRRFPYAVISKLGANGKPHNPLTFADIDSTQINTTDGAFPSNPIIGNSAFEVHNVGEVWASALFEVRARFITRLGWAVGNQRVLQFVTDGMKLDPTNPTFLQARDSILAAANAGGGTPSDIADIWAGFAARGMGISAQVVNAASGTVIEAFDMPGISAGTSTLVAESIPNGRLDPSEAVTVTFCIANNGTAASGAVTGALAVSGGVQSPTAPQSYGSIAAGASECRDFSFVVAQACGNTVTATLQVQEDGGATRNLSYSMQVGALGSAIFSENFDGVTSPSLPAGWTTTTLSGVANLWVTIGTLSDSAPNRTFAFDPPNVSDNVLTSPSFAVPENGRLSFRNSYSTDAGFDGSILEIAIGGGAFQDIIVAGGSFLSGGYNGTVNGENNPISGSPAWTGSSGGYLTTVVTMPAAAIGQNVRLRWRMTSGSSVGGTGVSFDTVSFTPFQCSAGSSAPTIWSMTPSSGAQGANIPVTLTGTNFASGMTVDAGANITPLNVDVVSATTATATFSVSANATPGARNVAVTTAGGASNAVLFTVLPPPPPSLSSISPASGALGANVDVTLTGTNFVAGLTVNAGNSIYVSNLNIITANSATARFTVDPASTLGIQSVSVTTTAGLSNALNFNVTPAAPVPLPPALTAITPNSGSQLGSVNVTLTGANFAAGMAIDAGANITVSNINVVNGSSAAARLTIGLNAALGLRDVFVTTSGGVSGAGTFTVLAPLVPTLTSIQPSIGPQASAVAMTLLGTNFTAGGFLINAGPQITAFPVTVVSSTMATVSLAIGLDATLGNRQFNVVTNSGSSGTVNFTVLPQRPTLTDITPTKVVPGTNTPVTLTGANFDTGGFQVSVTGANITVDPPVVVNSNVATTTFNVASNASFGGRAVAVTTSGGTASLPFSVTPFPPTLTTVGPASGRRGTAVPVTLTGTNFVAGAGITVNAGSGITASAVIVSGTTSATTTLTIALGSVEGDRSIVVGTTGGTSNALTFAVQPPPSPTFTSINPASGSQASNVPVTLIGTNFQFGGFTINGGQGITVSPGTVINGPGTQVTATLVINATAAQGPRNITVTTAGGVTSAQTFTVLPPPLPTLTSINPTAGSQTSNVSITLRGTNLQIGGFTINAGPGISVVGTPVVNVVGTQATATLAIGAAAPLGVRDITVTTVGGTSVTAVQFTVRPPAPTLTSLSPNFGIQGTAVPVTLTGTSFDSGGFGVIVSGTSIAVSDAVVLDGTTATATLTIDPVLRNSYTRNISVTTDTGSSGVLIFTAKPPLATITDVSPASGRRAAATLVTLTGTGFVAGTGATIVSAGSGITVAGLSIIDSTSATANLIINVNATEGPRDLTVTTNGGTSVPFTFTVNPPGVPTLTSITPETATQGSLVSLTLIGTNYSTGFQVRPFLAGTFTPDPSIGVSAVTFGTTTGIGVATLTISATSTLGTHDIVVVTVGGTSNALPFTVEPLAVPVISAIYSSYPVAPTGLTTAVTPPQGARGSLPFRPTTVPVTIQGSNFGATAALNRVVVAEGTSAGITISTVFTPVSGTSGIELRGALLIQFAATEGIKGITVNTDVGTSDPSDFTVKPPVPIVTGINPPSGAQGSTFPVTLYGANFATSPAAGLFVAIRPQGVAASGVTVADTGLTWGVGTFDPGVVQIINDNMAITSFTVDPSASLGPRSIRLGTDSGQSAVSPGTAGIDFANFTVQTIHPTFTRVTPSGGPQGASLLVTLSGTNFDKDGLFEVAMAGTGGEGLTLGPATVITGGLSATLQIDIAPDAVRDRRSMVITTSTTTRTLLNAFAVLNDPPVLTAIIPSSGGQGKAVPVTLQGSNFQPGLGGVALTIQPGSGIAVSSLVVNAAGTQATATLTIAPSTAAPTTVAAEGDRPIMVNTGAGTSNALTFTVNPAPVPVLTGISPSSGSVAAAVTVTFTGSGFIPGFIINRGPDITTGTQFVNAGGTAITIVLNIGPGATGGDREMTVHTAGGTSNAMTFRVLATPLPSLTSFSPNQALQGTNALTVTITGTNFDGGGFAVGNPGPGIIVSNVVVASNTVATMMLDIAADAPPGARALTVATVSGTSGALNFTVLPPPPTLTSLTPTAGSQGAIVPVTFTGTNFYSGLTVQTGPSMTATTVVVLSTTTATANLVVGLNASLGAHAISVATIGGTSGTLDFTVQAPQPPTLTSITPASVRQGQSVPVTLTGTNFITGLQVRATLAGTETVDSNITLNGLIVRSQTQATAILSSAFMAAFAARDILVTTLGGTSGTVTFTVLPPDTPVLSSITPAAGPQGSQVSITLTGANLSPSGFTINAGPDVSILGPVVFASSGASATATLSIDFGAAQGPRPITVTTVSGTSSSVIFTVLPPVLTFTAISPNLGARGTTVPVTMIGSSFDAGGLALNMASSSITVSSLNVLNATEATAVLAINAATPVNTYAAFLQAPYGTSGTVNFAIVQPAPSLTTTNPSTGSQGATVPVTLTGSNFLAGAGATTIDVSGTGITISGTTVINATSVRANFTMTLDATLGDRAVMVTTAGGTTSTLTFTVIAPQIPTLTSITPAFGNKISAVPVTLIGTNFIQGLTIDVGDNIAVNALVFSLTQATATFTAGIDAVLGVRNITVTTVGGVSNPVPFSVLPPLPKLTTIITADSVPGATVSVALSGQFFASGMTISVSAGTGIFVSNVQVSSPNAATATFVIASDANTGFRQISVTTVDGTSNSVSFGVTPPLTSQSFGGPPGGYINALVIDPQSPTRLYTATHGGGVFKSSNGGATWAPIRVNIPTFAVLSLAVSPASGGLYAGTDGAGVWFSVTGTNWAGLNQGLAGGVVNTIARATDPTLGILLYAGTNQGVNRCVPTNCTWTTFNSGLTNLVIRSLVIDPVTQSTLYAGTEGGVFRSTNSGTTWVAVNTGLTTLSVWTLAIDLSAPTTLYAGTNGGGVFKSTDSGGNWSAVNTGLTDVDTTPWIKAVVIDPSAPTTLYAGIYGGSVYKTINGGNSWFAVNSGLTDPLIRSLAIDPTTPSTIYVGSSGGGVYKSNDAGTSWTASTAGITNSVIRSMVNDPDMPSTLYVATEGSGAYKSFNGGISWTAISSGLSASIVTSLVIDPSAPATLYAGSNGGGVFKSFDRGNSWTAINSGLTNPVISALAIDASAPNILYAGSNGSGVFKSPNGGNSWIATNSGMGSARIFALAIDPSDPAILYAATSGGVFRTFNAGADWTAVNSGLTDLDVDAIVIDPSAPGTLYAGTIGGGAFKTINGGNSWTAINSGMANANVFSLLIDPKTPTTIYAGMSVLTNGIYKSTNGGTTWSAAATGMTPGFVSSLAIDPSNSANLYSGSHGGGTYRSTNAAANWQATGLSFGNGAAPATAITKLGGDGQTAIVNQTARYPLSAVVTNGAGIPVAGLSVNFVVTAGSGALFGTQAVTDSSGVAFTSLTVGALPGANTVTATAAGVPGTLTYTVTALPSAPPTLTGILPLSGYTGNSINVTLTGTSFVPGLTINAGTNIIVSNVNVLGGTLTTATFAVGANATLGERNVTVTTGEGTSGAAIFTVVASVPTLTSIAPISGSRGNSVHATLSGTNFASGLSVDAGSNVTVSNIVVVSGTSATATFAIDLNAVLGLRNVTVTTIGGTSNAVTFTVLAAPLQRQSDLNGDGHADLIWANAATGQTAYWLMDGAVQTSAGVLLTDPDWKAAASADFNGDGKTDIVWYNAASGATAIWLMDGAATLSSVPLLIDPDWKVSGAPDLNGDGKADLIWRNAASGQTAYWLMNGAVQTASALLLTDSNWEVIFTPDLNGDGKADLIWQNAAAGQTTFWLMDGGAVTGSGSLLADLDWKVIFTPDLNGDGKADLILENAAIDQTDYWLLDGGVWTSGGPLLRDPFWRTIRTADLNGDGKDDLIWRNATSGETVYELMDGGATVASGLLLEDTRWTVAGTVDLNGDGKADLIWHDAAAGATAYWLMNGGSPIAAGLLQTASSWKTLIAGQPGGAGNTGMYDTAAPRLITDLNGDGKADLIWENTTAGQTAYALMNGGYVASSGTLLLDPAWKAEFAPDLNGDGKADLIWNNTTTGETAYWLMDGGVATAVGSLLTNLSWKVVFTPDLNGDGKADLIWYNATTGQTIYWLMDGGAVSSAGSLLTNQSWKVLFTPDLNGDGKADLIWNNETTGQTAYWLMNGGALVSSGVLLTDLGWKVIFTPDLNGDGKADLIWYKAGTGQTAYWLMNGGVEISGGLLLTHPEWKVVLTPDLNRDGKADLIWYNALTGQTGYWLMNGGARTSSELLLTHPNWTPVGTSDLSGDGKGDLIWYNASTGQTAYWLMNGTVPSSVGLLSAGTDWITILMGQ